MPQPTPTTDPIRPTDDEARALAQRLIREARFGALGTLDPDTAVFAATTYAPGVFASHIVLGNTNLHRVVTVQHNALNLLHSQGIRILVRRSGAHSRTPRSA